MCSHNIFSQTKCPSIFKRPVTRSPASWRSNFATVPAIYPGNISTSCPGSKSSPFTATKPPLAPIFCKASINCAATGAGHYPKPTIRLTPMVPLMERHCAVSTSRLTNRYPGNNSRRTRFDLRACRIIRSHIGMHTLKL